MSNCEVVCADNGALLVKSSAEMTRQSQPSAVIPAELVTVSAGTAVSPSSNQPSFCQMSMVHEGIQAGALGVVYDESLMRGLHPCIVIHLSLGASVSLLRR